MEYGAGVNDSETKLTSHDVMPSKSHLEVCQGVTLTSDSLSSTSSSSPGSRHHPGQSSMRQDHSERVQTTTVPDKEVLDTSVESEVPPEAKHIRCENIAVDRHSDPDDGSTDNISLSEYKSVVDLSTSKTFSTDVDQRTSLPRCQMLSETDLDEVPDTASQRSSLQTSTVVFCQPVSLVHN